MNIKTLSLCALFSLSLTACSHVNNTVNTLENATPQQKSGALIGALAGATGATLIGAPVAATIIATALGAGVGYYIKTPVVEYGLITDNGGTVFVQGDYMIITLPSDSLFEANTARLREGSTTLLNRVVDILKPSSDKNILVTANTDNIASKSYQYELSVNQAGKIAAFFWSKGILQDNQGRTLDYAGMGSFDPVANNGSAQGTQQNRRVTIVVFPQKHPLNTQEKPMVIPAM